MTGEMSHLDESGRARMVDVGSKPETVRTATASARLTMSRETAERIRSGAVAKGDVLAVAQVAAVQAAKRTCELVPMCHPVRLTAVDVSFESDVGAGAVGDEARGTEAALAALDIFVTVRAVDRTGVEMEALTAASVAALTVYDMVKSIDRGVVIGPVRLEHKAGGKSGEWRHGAVQAETEAPTSVGPDLSGTPRTRSE